MVMLGKLAQPIHQSVDIMYSQVTEVNLRIAAIAIYMEHGGRSANSAGPAVLIVYRVSALLSGEGVKSGDPMLISVTWRV